MSNNQMQSLFKVRKQQIYGFKQWRNKVRISKKKEVPEYLYSQCPFCKESLLVEELERHHYVCFKCQTPLSMSAYRRIDEIVDDHYFKEIDRDMETNIQLDFPGYKDKLKLSQESTHLKEACVCGIGKINQYKVAIGVLDSRFFMGSMGSVVGEKITRLIEQATKQKLPLVIFSASGGARMQEGIVSLMQMAKTSAALAKHNEAGLLYISYLTHPTTGGVTASFAMLGDIILAEPKALIGFAGPRVIEQTIKKELPEGFQRSEFLLAHGFIDHIVERKDMKQILGFLIDLHVSRWHV